MGKGKREVVIGILTFELFENNFILRQEHKILSAHTKISIAWNCKKKEMNTWVYFYLKGCHKVTQINIKSCYNFFKKKHL